MLRKKKISILFIADTHNDLQFDENAIELMKKQKKYDCCILLGDHSAVDLKIIQNLVPKDKIFGVLGNHDAKDAYQHTGIKHIHGEPVFIKGVSIIGFSGSFKYKDVDTYAMYTQNESMEIASKFPPCDILVSHVKPLPLKYIQSDQVLKDGLAGITTYIDNNKPAYHVHGHMHTNSIDIISAGTTSYGVYGAKIITFRI